MPVGFSKWILPKYLVIVTLCIGTFWSVETYAQCPPNPGSGETIEVLPTCCDLGINSRPCGINPSQVDVSLVKPTITVTPDAGNCNRVRLVRSPGSMTVTTYGACIGPWCDGGPRYIWTPYKRIKTSTPSLTTTNNYPSSAKIGGDNNYIDTTGLTDAQASIRLRWYAGIGVSKVDDQDETISLKVCNPLPTKPTPKATLYPSCGLSGVPCAPNSPDPADPYSGDYFYANEDITVPSVIPLKVIRHYTSSLTSYVGPFGVGTQLMGYNYKINPSLNLDGTVNTSPNQNLTFDPGNGITVSFTNGSSGGLVFTNTDELGTAGTVLTLSVDGSNFLSGAAYTTPQKTQYNFDSNGRLSAIVDAHGNTVSITRDTSGNVSTISSLGRSLTFTYNTQGLVSKIQDHTGRSTTYTYDTNNQLLVFTNTRGYTDQYNWDDQHRIILTQDAISRPRLVNYYLANGMIKQQSLLMGSTTLPYGANYIFKVTGPLERVITDPNGNSKTYTYDNHGLLVQFKDGLNHTYTTTYSASLFNGGSLNRYVEKTDPLSHTVRTDLNLNNLPVTITDALNNVTNITYDTVWPDKIASITDPMNQTTTYTYDTNGDLVTVTDANSKQTTFTYNSRGQVLTKTNALNKTTAFAYNTAGDLVSITDPLSRQTTFTRDALGRAIAIIDPKNQTTQIVYNSASQIAEITDPSNKTIEIDYTSRGDIDQIKDKLNHTTSYSYDIKQHLTAIHYPDPPSVSKSIYFKYDAGDRLLNIEDPKNQNLELLYDAANRVTQARVKVGSTYPITYNYTFDNADRLTNILSGTNNWTYTYDNADRITSLVSPQGTVGYEYNANDLRTKLTATGHPDTTYTYDNLNRLLTVAQSTNTYTYGYDDISRRISMSRPNGVSSSYTYDDADQLTQLRHLKSGVIDEQHDYTYDNNSNILTYALDGGLRTFTYDNLDRLTKMVKTLPVPGEALPKQIDYTYDDMGNIKQRKETDDSNNITTYTFTHDKADQITQVAVSPGSTTTFTYDKNGNMTADSTGRSFTWNALDQLTSATAGGLTTSFGYDPIGRRISLSNTSTSKSFFYDDADLISDGINKYINGAGIDEPLQATDSSSTSSYLSNHLGSITQPTNASGASLGKYQYMPYGKALSSSTPVTNNSFTYTAREDDGNGLYYYRSRYYDPQLEAFISQDPLGEAQRYVNGNPLIYTDPFGLGAQGAATGAAIVGPIGAGIGAIVGGVGAGGTCTLAAPGVGTIGCGIAGGTQGIVLGGLYGAAGGGAVGSIIEDLSLWMAKGGKQNNRNPYTLQATIEAKSSGKDPCDILDELYKASKAIGDSKAAQDIKRAQKQMGCRRNSQCKK